jgi:hypothetical protein
MPGIPGSGNVAASVGSVVFKFRVCKSVYHHTFK